MNLRVFYAFERGPQAVLSTAPRPFTSQGVCEQLLPWLTGGDDYIGLLDEADNLLQILREPQSDDYWIELPVAEQRLSYGKRVDAHGLAELLERLPRRFLLRELPDFHPRPWTAPP